MNKKNSKNNLKHVCTRYPLTLDLKHFTEMNERKRFDVSFDSSINTKYVLSGIISHKNGNLNSNYTTLVHKFDKEKNEKNWLKFIP